MRTLALAIAAVALLALAAGPTAASVAPGTIQANQTQQQDEAPGGQDAFTWTCEEVTCHFDARDARVDNGTIEAYEWNFGDQNAGEGARVNHTYAEPGTYNVTLTLVTEDGSETDATRMVQVTADRPEPGTVPWTGLAVGVFAFLGSLVVARMT